LFSPVDAGRAATELFSWTKQPVATMSAGAAYLLLRVKPTVGRRDTRTTRTQTQRGHHRLCAANTVPRTTAYRFTRLLRGSTRTSTALTLAPLHNDVHHADAAFADSVYTICGCSHVACLSKDRQRMGSCLQCPSGRLYNLASSSPPTLSVIRSPPFPANRCINS